MYKRLTPIPNDPKSSFFLWGPRQTGKTTLLKNLFPEAMRIDLLKTDELLRYLQTPSILREEVEALPANQIVVIDEIQKVPQLLDEIHWLIEEKDRTFALSGSSARKVKRGHANLLGGRAVRYELFGLNMMEIGKEFSLVRFLNNGSLPNHYNADNAKLLLRSYVEDYLKEEILEEGLTRNLPVFSDFLRITAIGDTEILNMSNVARETGVALSTVRDHFQILVDTLLGAFLPAFTKRPKRRTIQAPKFYFRDVGVVNHLAKRGQVEIGSELFGKAFENWLFHELSSHSSYSELFYELSYWRLSSGIEVDFIIGEAKVAVEAKGKTRITSTDLKGLIQFKKDYPEVEHRIIVCLEKRARITDTGILILPYSYFIKGLWEGKWV